jgi:hypothetical protein
MRAKILAGIASAAAIVGSGIFIPVAAANAATCDVEIGCARSFRMRMSASFVVSRCGCE